ncbi:MAG: NAD-dependent epimerase/dehydratase family protein [Trueperaceae bacterium]
MSEIYGRKVLVTGATGFIGGRLVERLNMAEGAAVRVLVSGYSRCARVARFPVELARADLLDRNAVTEAAKGCSVIFHCAYGSRGGAKERRLVNIEGTENVLAAAAVTGARVVHLSSQMVYGLPEQGDIDERAPRRRTGSTYGDSKLEAEERVLRAAAEGLPVTVLQPTAVYGPLAPVWTVGVLERMRVGKVPLIDSGAGACNAVYIDDVVEAMLLAATSDDSLGECFLISAAEPVTWREFYGQYEEMLGVPATVPVTLAQATRGANGKPARSLLRELPDLLLNEPTVRQRLARTVEGKALVRLLRGKLKRGRTKSATPELDRLRSLRRVEEAPLHPLTERDATFFASHSRVRIDKARSSLGYRPKFGLIEGMELTGAWARWAGLVPSGGKESEIVAGSA